MSGRQSFGVGKFKGLLLVGCFSLLVEFLLDFASSVIAGNLLGAKLGYEAIPEKFKDNLELRELLLSMADKLCERTGGTLA